MPDQPLVPGGAPDLAQPSSTTAPVAPSQTDPLPPGVTAAGDKVKLLSRRTFGKIIGEAEDRGRKGALSEYARDLGFGSVEEMRTAAQRGKNGGGGGNDRRDRDRERDRNDRRDERKDRDRDKRETKGDRDRRLDREREQREEAERRARTEERRRKDAEREARAAEGRYELMLSARAAGCTDPEYAVELLHRHMQSITRGKQPSEVRQLVEDFDDDKWFAETLKKEKPHLFGASTQTERVVPASTGTGGQRPAEPAPVPRPPTEQQVRDTDAAKGGPVDARNLNKTEYSNLTTKLGLHLDG